jgi:ATP-dependent DNA helicase RecQ
MSSIAFFDFEVHPPTERVLDIGCIRSDKKIFHDKSIRDFLNFIKDCDYLCGHNILTHDLKYLQSITGKAIDGRTKTIDTLLLSPLLFPKRPYHRLPKDDPIQPDETNDPLIDAKKAWALFEDEIAGFHELPEEFKTILYLLLNKETGFGGFFHYLRYQRNSGEESLETYILKYFGNAICQNADLLTIIKSNPVALAYSLALINTNDSHSVTPPWVLKNHPQVENILFLLRRNPCNADCHYCNNAYDAQKALNTVFGIQNFREFDGKPLQEQAVKAAINNESFLTVFPTGGGKSITFQLPALLSGKNAWALTVVISPLQSLMKDQVDKLDQQLITEAVTINGLLNPIERGKAIERVEDGNACILYIAPESLRSFTIERLLLKRKIARFVIDEAHCFSTWGQDFRVDYLYIGDFIRELREMKNLDYPIPVSCFTATAKLKVIEDIKTYFNEKLSLTLDVFHANPARPNLYFRVYQKNDEADKYTQLRYLIEEKDSPKIIYVSRTKKAYRLAKRLTDDGFPAKPYHGKMDKEEKKANQDSFMNGEINIIVATSAFGMGIDKPNIGAVIHYDISDSLENYIQEAGRAGRDEKMDADCFILFNEEDLDKHFQLLNKTKLSCKEINQVWRAIKGLTRTRSRVSNSALEIARKAGWDENINEVETKVLTAIAALESAGFIKRGHNMPRVFATSILSKTANEAIARINSSSLFDSTLKVIAIRVIRKLFSSKSKRLATEEEAESRVDYISDQLGIAKEKIIRVIELLKQEKILDNTKDITAFIKKGERAGSSQSVTDKFRQFEEFLISVISEEQKKYSIKKLNEDAIRSGLSASTVTHLKTIINFWAIRNWAKKNYIDLSRNHLAIHLSIPRKDLMEKIKKRHWVARLIVDYLYKKTDAIETVKDQNEILIEFSVLELKEMVQQEQGLFDLEIMMDDIEDTLFYLSRIEAINIEGGFLVIYNRLTIDRLEENNRIQYKESDYAALGNFYRQKVQQIHIVGEYARKMIQNHKEALEFVQDYFALNHSSFLSKYFSEGRQEEIVRTMTPGKYKKLFSDLSANQMKIIQDNTHQYIVVAAGPGSGKTKVLVHKLASLLLAEDVKPEQLLMLTFSRSAVTEFKKRLSQLVGNAAAFVEIKTFHSYCFNLLGRVGNLEQSGNIIQSAIEKIKNGDIEMYQITKTALVVDEAQDISADEYELIKILMEKNEDMRVIAVGDDDQNIFEFRGADSGYMKSLLNEKSSVKYELTENYRSMANIVDFANQWALTIGNRQKTQPGISHSRENGNISITKYTSNNLIVPLCNAIRDADLSGSTCIITKTNEEAALITGLLLKKGTYAKLIQGNEGFKLQNLYELRYFSDQLLLQSDNPVISPESWLKAVQLLSEHVRSGTKTELAMQVIKEFETVNKKVLYKSDWQSFLDESSIEDFLSIDSETIYVSTIHKAKGKEFDNVYLLLNRFYFDTDAEKRQLYVALTRAKNNLHIHYNDSYLQHIQTENLVFHHNIENFPEPEYLSLLLTHRDVNLGYFGYVQHRMEGLLSGFPLTVLEDGLGNSKGERVLKFSSGFCDELNRFFEKGYHLCEASVNFIVYWKDTDQDNEIKIILPGIGLKKEGKHM